MQALHYQGHPEMSIMHRRFDADSLLQRLERLVAPTKSVQHTAEPVVCWGMVGPNADCPAQAILSLFVPPLNRC
jgi:hypothetical protein